MRSFTFAGLVCIWALFSCQAQLDPWSAVQQSAEAGTPEAQYRLGNAQFSGTQGQVRDRVAGIKWLRRAAELGHREAQEKLCSYLNIVVIPPGSDKATFAWPDISLYRAEAPKWCGPLAEQGDFRAQHNMGRIYGEGIDFSVDFAESVYWFSRAARQGNAFSQYELAVSYFEGRGVPQDFVLAHLWANLAASQSILSKAGDEALQKEVDRVQEIVRKQRIDLRDRIRAMLMPEQLARAQELASSWRPKPERPQPSSPDTEQEQDSGTPSSFGTGFWVNQKGFLLTNNHVVDSCGRLTVLTANGRESGVLFSRDESNDLALVKSGANAGSSFLSFSQSRCRLGQSVVVVGFPLRGVLASAASVTTGTISALAGIQDDARMMQITAPIQPGSSGGPLLDESGNVIGVVTSTLDALKFAEATGGVPQNVNFAVKSSVVTAFLESRGVDYSERPSNTPLSTTQIAERGSQTVAVVECWP